MMGTSNAYGQTPLFMSTAALRLHDRRAASLATNGRDSRAASTSTKGTVSVPETCGYYGVADSISRCRAPRSCQDCLAMPGCGIESGTRCLNLTSASYEFHTDFDYRKANFPNGSLVSNTSSFNFIAGTATYCAAADAICTKCREEFRHIAIASTQSSYGPPWTAFCKGDNGCVCIGLCELPERRAILAADPECDQPRSYHLRLPKIVRDTHTTRRGDPRAISVPLEFEPKKEESCAYTKEVDMRGCRVPRTCRSCLSKPGCMLSDAKCIEANAEVYLRDFRNVSLDNNNMGYAYSTRFISSNTTYCPASDATCATCRKLFPENSFNDWSNFVGNSYFCVGQDGCVCIQACEDDSRVTGVYDTDCNLSISGPENVSPVTTLILVAVTWIILWPIYKVWTRKPSPRNDRRPGQTIWRNMLDEVPRVTRLDLFGWRAYREELLLREQELLHGLEVMRPLGNPVDFENMDPSAPEFDDDESSAPTAHDPNALASAPLYRGSFQEDHGTADESDLSSPSAPAFDPDELELQFGDRSHGEHIGLVTRRPRQGDIPRYQC